MLNCATGTLAPYSPAAGNDWDRVKAVHLHRRAGFGTGIYTVLADLERSPVDVVADLVQTAIDLPLSPEPEFSGRTQAEYGGLALLGSTLEKDGWARQWIIDLQANGLRGRMAFFWHNHFVTRFDVHESSNYTYQYHRLLQEYAVGNFRDFVRAMGTTPAMLVYLNGAQNLAGQPNENYARELYELFTLGDDNGYTQTDIEETARALTGYTNITEPWGPILFDPATHDDGEKTIFGRTGNWGYDDVIDLLFTERAPEIARFIAGELYEKFVNPAPDEAFIALLAAALIEADWEIAPVLAALFSSEHFFDPANFGTIIPGPIEHQLIIRNETNSLLNGLSIFGDWAEANEQGQLVFNPVDVAGWPGNRSWMNTTTVRRRWEWQASLFNSAQLFSYGYFQDLVRGATEETVDVEIICRDLIRYFLPNGLQFETDYAAALVAFKANVPIAFFEDGTWNTDNFATPFQLAGLLNFLGRLPEFQLR